MSRAALAREAAPAAKAAGSRFGARPTAPEAEREHDGVRGKARPSWSLAKLGQAAPCGASCQCASCSAKRAAASPFGAGKALEGSARADMERGFGRDFGDVRVHTGPAAARSAARAGAGAFAHGKDIVFGAGFYAPQTAGGRAILAHELAHVAQQSGGAPSGGASREAAEAEAHQAGRSVLTGGAVRVKERTGRQVAALSLADARKELWGHVPDSVKDYVRPAARMAAEEMDKVIPPNTEIPKPIEDLARHPIDTTVHAVEHPIEAAQTVVQTAKEVAPIAKAAAGKVYDQAGAKLHDVTQRAKAKASDTVHKVGVKAHDVVEAVKVKAKEEVHDAVMGALGDAKAVSMQVTNIVDTVAWVPYAAHEMEQKMLGDSAAAQKFIAATDAISGYAGLQYLATHGYGQIDPITHEPTGALDLSDAAGGAIDEFAGKTDTALGGDKSGGGMMFTTYEQREIKTSIGIQVGLSLVGVEEVEIGLKAVGLIGSVKGLVDAVRANPEGWWQDPNFAAAVIGVGLNLVGLKQSLAAKKITQIIIAGGQLAMLTPIVLKMCHDYKTMPAGPERDKAMRKSAGELIKGVGNIIIAVAQGHGAKKPGGGEEPAGGGAGKAPADAAPANENVAPAQHEAAPAADTTAKAPTADTPAAPPAAAAAAPTETPAAPAAKAPASDTPAAPAAKAKTSDPVQPETPAAKAKPAAEAATEAPHTDEHAAKTGGGAHEEVTAVNKSDAEAEAPTGEGHEVIATKDGLGCCSPGPCPVIHVKYRKQLAEHPALKARYEEIQQTRKTNPKQAANEAAELVKRLEELSAPPPTAAERVMKAQGDDRGMTREQWKAAHGKERWKAAVEKAFEGDITEKTEVPRVTGGAKSGYRIDDTKVPGRPKPRVDVSASPDERDTALPVREGETPREAVARVRQVIGRKISDFPALEKLWNKARGDTLSRNQLTAENYGKLYDFTRDRFWGLVAADTPDGAAARAILDSAGIGFDAQGRAPTLEGVGSGVKRAETVVSLDHIEEKAQGDNWKKALDADNLNFEFARPNTNREVVQARHPELRQ